MKAKMKLAALVFALVFAVVSFAGCGGSEEDDKKDTQARENVSSKSGEKEKGAEDIAEEFFNKFFAADFDGAKKYVDPDSALYSELDTVENKFKEKFVSSSGLDGIGDKTDKAIDKLIDTIFAMMSYKIGDSEISEESANITVALTRPSDIDSLISFESIDENKILADYFKSIGKTQEEFTEEASSYTVEQQKEFQADLIAYMLDFVNDELKDKTDYETETEETTLSLKKVEGKWLVEDDGDFFFE